MNLKIFKTKCNTIEKIFVLILLLFLSILIFSFLKISTFDIMTFVVFFILIPVFTTLWFIAYIDFKSMEIPNLLSLILLLFLLCINIFLHFKFGLDNYIEITTNWQYIPYDNFVAALFLGLIFLLIVIATKEKALGLGDVRIALIVGLLIGQNNILPWLYITVFTSLIYGLILGRKKGSIKNLKIPFTPFMILGVLSTILIRYFLF